MESTFSILHCVQFSAIFIAIVELQTHGGEMYEILTGESLESDPRHPSQET